MAWTMWPESSRPPVTEEQQKIYESRQKIKNLKIEEFISCVQNQPMLWDPTHEHYRNKKTVLEAWHNIAIKCDIGRNLRAIAAKQKWKDLKWNFQKELKKKAKMEKDNDESVFVSNWPFFKNMQFLLGVKWPVKKIKQHIVQDNILVVNLDSCSDSSTETSSDAHNSSVPLQSAEGENSASCSSFRLKRTRAATANRKRKLFNSEELDYLENERFKQVEKEVLEEKDDNYRFLMNLVPVLKQLPVLSQMTARIKFQEVLLSEFIKMRENRLQTQRE